MKSLKVNLFYNILLNVSTIIFPLITAPYVARVLEPDGVGIFNFSNTYASYFALVALLGIPTYGIREVSKLRDDKSELSRLLSELMSIAGITTITVSIVYVSSLFIVNQLNENYVIFFMAGFAVYLAPFKINWYYQGLEEFGFITLRTLIIRIISIICLFIFVKQKEDVVIYVILNVAGGVIGDIWNFFRMWRSGVKPKFTMQGLKKHLKPLLILFSSTIAISIYTTLDTLMLGFMKNYSEVGYYNSATHLSRAILYITTSFSAVAVPRVSYFSKNNDFGNITNLLNKSFSFVAFVAFPLAIGMMCVASVFVPIFYGVKFEGAVIPLIILSLLIIIISLNNLTGNQTLIGMGYDKLFFYSVLTGTISNFILNFILIPFWGAVGASISSVAAEFLVLTTMIYFIYKYTPVRISGISETAKSFWGSLLFIPLVLIERLVLDGWYLIGTFLISGSVLYLFAEWILNNKSLTLFVSSANKIIRKNE